MTKIIFAACVLVVLTTGATAQQRTFYDNDGKPVARSTTDTQGTVTTFGADGRTIARESTTRSGSTVYDAKTGRAIGKTTGDKR
jgi:hypothetical protein